MRSLLLVLLLAACASKPKAPELSFDDWVIAQEQRSWGWLQLNISPAEPKAPGGPVPRRGVVVAALHKKDPDYYFHWVRDSANVMRVLVEREKVRGGDPHPRFKDFLELSRDLQNLHSPYGMGEPRYTVEGKVDPLKWSRPQYDGPALRALAVMQYLEDFSPPPDLRRLALEVLRQDLEFTRAVWTRRGFDIWEELYADNYHTRLVQMAALEKGEKYFPRKLPPLAERGLLKALDLHWSPPKKYLRSQTFVERTDGYTKKNTDLDSAVVIAVVEGGRLHGAHSVMDAHVQATVAALENVFRQIYPINSGGLGLVYGRYVGDTYYGGNPWPLITAIYAQFYYRLARALAQEELVVDNVNREFIEGLCPHPPERFVRGSAAHKDLLQAAAERGDQIMARLRAPTPTDGQFFEQMDKANGHPISSRGLGWAHAAFISASLERRQMLKELPR